MKINKITCYFAAVLITSLFVGCSHSSYSWQKPTGSWSTELGERIIFNKNGSFSIKSLPPDNNPSSITELNGTWKMVNSSNVEVEIATPTTNYSTIYQFQISADVLSISQPGVPQAKNYIRDSN